MHKHESKPTSGSHSQAALRVLEVFSNSAGIASDRIVAERGAPSDTVLLAALLYGPMEEAVFGVRDPAGAFDEFFLEISERLAIPRRTRDRLRLILAAQRRLDRGRHAPLRRREFFDDAAVLFVLRCRAAGRPVPEWLYDECDGPVLSRRRRRGRRSRRDHS